MKKEIADLIKFIETQESTKLRNWSKSKEDNIYDYAPVNSQGSPDTDLEARPTIGFRIDYDDESFILSWLYLSNPGQGLGRHQTMGKTKNSGGRNFRKLKQMAFKRGDQSNGRREYYSKIRGDKGGLRG